MSGLFGGGGSKAQPAAAPVAASAPKAAPEVEATVDRGGRPVSAGSSSDLIRRLGFTGASGRSSATGSSMLGK